MSDIYCISTVAGLALNAACSEYNTASGKPTPQICNDAIRLVQSAAKLIAAILYQPNSELDGIQAGQTHHKSYEASILHKIADHIDLFRTVCDRPRYRVGGTSDASQKSLHAWLAVRPIDKPNVHRFLELSMSAIPMFGHVTCFGELGLEKTHQVLNLAIQRSNHKTTHLCAMKTAAFPDWQGLPNLCMMESASKEAQKCALRRLRGGRESLNELGNICPLL